MSAWTLSKIEIDVLVWWANHTGVSKQDTTSLGRMLWSENYKSIRARYGQYDIDGKYVRTPAYKYSPPPESVRNYNGLVVQTQDPDQASKMCHFYTYQSCEHSDWESSRAKRIIDKLDSHLVKHYNANWGKDGLAWGINPASNYELEA